MASQKVLLPGSERQPVGTRVADQSPDEVIEVSIILKPKSPLPAPHAGGPIVSRHEFAAKYGADPAAVEKIKEFAAENHLTVTEVSSARRTVKLEGTASDLMTAFSASLEICDTREIATAREPAESKCLQMWPRPYRLFLASIPARRRGLSFASGRWPRQPPSPTPRRR